jgi:hypothetical protein
MSTMDFIHSWGNCLFFERFDKYLVRIHDGSSWQGSDDKGPVEFAGDTHYQPGIAGVQFLVDARFDRFNGSVFTAYVQQIWQFFNHIGQGTAYLLAIKGTGFFSSIGGYDYLVNSVCLHICFLVLRRPGCEEIE